MGWPSKNRQVINTSRTGVSGAGSAAVGGRHGHFLESLVWPWVTGSGSGSSASILSRDSGRVWSPIPRARTSYDPRKCFYSAQPLCSCPQWFQNSTWKLEGEYES